LDASALAALQAGNGPTGGTRGVALGLAPGLGDAEALGVADEAGEGLVVSDGLGVGAASAGLEKSANDKVAAATKPAGNLR
jgi:hypothetical protein